ncbi:Npun_F0296 family exosortase-dependent surface protein [Thermaurantiacus sp.]
MRTFLLGLALASLAMPAGAVTFTKGAYALGPAPGEQLVVTFDAPSAPGFSMTGTAGVYNGAAGLISGVARPLPGNSSLYMSVRRTPLEFAQLDAATPMRSMSIDLGSLDPTNLLSFYTAGGGLVASFTGTQLAFPGAATGSGTNPHDNARFFFNFGSTPVSRVVFTSGQNSFEFDNIGAAVVPEPGTWAMLIAGFALVGLSLRRRRQQPAVTLA